MSQSYYNCVICNQIQGEYSHHGHCEKCGFVCGSCYNKMIEKYPENESGENLKQCDACVEIMVKAYQITIKTPDESKSLKISKLYTTKETCLKSVERLRQSSKSGNIITYEEISIPKTYVTEGVFDDNACVEWGTITIGELDLLDFIRTHKDRKVRVTIELLE